MYREIDAWNQSSIKAILGYPDGGDKYILGQRKHITLGTAVDMILSYPNYNELMYLYKDKEPSETMTGIINHAYNLDVYLSKEAIVQAIIERGYIGNRAWTIEKRYEEVYNQTEEYRAFVLQSQHKAILSPEQLQKAENIVSNLYTATNTQELIQAEGIRQHEIYFEYDDLNCKAQLDKTIDYGNAIQPLDYKVTSVPFNQWKKSVARHFRYDIQAAFYTLALSKKYPDKQILPFKFIVASDNPNTQPYVFTCSPEDILCGRDGFYKHFSISINGEVHIMSEYYPGYQHGLYIIKQAQENNLTHYDIEGHLNDRNLNLNLWI